MQYFFLIVINILIASIFYLIITIKLERSADDYRSKKLKKEIEDLIYEFNLVAERNLTLLEHRINLLKKLLKQAGVEKGLDIILKENNFERYKDKNNIKDECNTKIEVNNKFNDNLKNNGILNNNESTNKLDTISIKDNTRTSNNKGKNKFSNIQISDIFNDVKNKIVLFFENFMFAKNRDLNTEKITSKDKKFNSSIDYIIDENKEKSLKRMVQNKEISKHYNIFNEAKSNISSIETNGNINKKSKSNSIIEKDIEELKRIFYNANDKYELIHKLYNEGYSPELLSKVSGMSVGEIELVLNISK